MHFSKPFQFCSLISRQLACHFQLASMWIIPAPQTTNTPLLRPLCWSHDGSMKTSYQLPWDKILLKTANDLSSELKTLVRSTDLSWKSETKCWAQQMPCLKNWNTESEELDTANKTTVLSQELRIQRRTDRSWSPRIWSCSVSTSVLRERMVAAWRETSLVDIWSTSKRLTDHTGTYSAKHPNH